MYTHDFFPFPAKFPPEPIREIITKYSEEGDTVLDPFCGSGTVLVEALLTNRHSIGIDVNPVAALVSKAKAIIYHKSDINQLEGIIKKGFELQGDTPTWIATTNQSQTLPSYLNIEHWFRPIMIEELAAIRRYFLDNSDVSPNVNVLLWMAFLRIIIPTSNQESDTRYASIEKPEIIQGFALSAFLAVLEQYHKSLEEHRSELMGNDFIDANVIEGDALSKMMIVKDSTIDLVVTSPPYINTYDYYLYHKHRIFWMNRDPREIRAQEIGNHHRIDTMSYQKATTEYETYLLHIFSELHKKLKKNKFLAILIGDGIVKGRVVKVDELIMEISTKTGFNVVVRDSIDLRNVSKGFIKGRNLDLKKHHSIVLQR